MSEKSNDIEEIEMETIDGEKEAEGEKTMVVADSVLPPNLPVVPLFDRPLFPKMMAPIVLGNNKESKALIKAVEENSQYVGLVLVKEQEEGEIHPAMIQRKPPESMEEFHRIGVIAKILQISGKEGKFVHMMVQVLERFEIKELLSLKPFVRAKVEYKKDEKAI